MVLALLKVENPVLHHGHEIDEIVELVVVCLQHALEIFLGLINVQFSLNGLPADDIGIDGLLLHRAFLSEAENIFMKRQEGF